MSLINDASIAFRAHFGREPTIGAIAPGRVNLIGDHTDYSGGLAMPCAIDLYTIALAAPAPGPAADSRLSSTQLTGAEVLLPAQAETAAMGDWADYLRGVRAGYEARDISMPPMDILIAGNLPLGSGLSSSASLELCFANLIEASTGSDLKSPEKALLCQTAEREFAGVPCGILDQFAISHAEPGKAMILDCREQRVSQTPLPADFDVIVIDSGVRHDLSDGGYADRRRSVEAAEAALGKSLRDTNLTEAQSLSDTTLRKRASHVVTENERVPEFASALAADDLQTAGQVMRASHRSLAQDFEVSCAELDWLVDAVVERGAYGARLTGGGFGGSIICLAGAATLPAIETLIEQDYLAAFGKHGTLRRLRAVGAATSVNLEQPHG